jgi:dTDP-4-dehydrorhamnose 3,5-epimerase
MGNSIEFNESFLNGVFLRNSPIHLDQRGSTLEWFDSVSLPANFKNMQINQLISATSKKNVIRGIHFSGTNNPQNKVVRCINGTILDIVIDLRRSSDTFGRHEIYILDSNRPETLFIPNEFGHAYQVLSKNATVVYALQTNFEFGNEHVINPLDPKLNLPWRKGKYTLSNRDLNGKNFDHYFC